MNNSTNYTTPSTIGVNDNEWKLSPGFFLFSAIFDILLATTTSMANFLLLFTIYRDPNRCLRTPTTYLIVNLGTSDFLNGILVGYGRATEEIYEYLGISRQFPFIIGGITHFSAALTLFVNLVTIMGISFDIFIATTKPLNYITSVTPKVICRGIAISWLLGTFLAVLPLVYGILGSFFILLVYCYSHFLIPAVLLPVVYTKIFVTLAVQQKNIGKIAPGSSYFLSQTFSLKRKRKTTYTTLTVLSLFYVSFLPYFIKVHILYFCTNCFQVATIQGFHVLSNQFLMFACLANPFLYAWRVPKFRQALKDLLRSCSRRRQRRNTVGPSVSLVLAVSNATENYRTKCILRPVINRNT